VPPSFDGPRANERIVSVSGAAFLYFGGNYSTREQRLMGRQSASEGLLRGYFRHGRTDSFHCVTSSKDEFAGFSATLAEIRPAATAAWIPFGRPSQLAPVGCLYRPGPAIADLGWLRQQVDPRSFSLCGVTHTTAELRIMDVLGDLVTAPLHDWDAVVCTSRAVHAMVKRLTEDWCAYLSRRLHADVTHPVRLPIIPLGVDTDAFRTPDDTARAQFRANIGAAPDDIVVLYLGRLNMYEKANPLPMYVGLERAARRTARRLHLVHAGWFSGQNAGRDFPASAARLAPSITSHFLDGRRPNVRRNVWHAADIFVSLPDNIQETFGLTPIEAMAAGLPVVAADWDGYRDTVRHEQEALLVPTVTPPPGDGADLALLHATTLHNYSQYCGATAAATAVDIDATADAFARLADDPALRRRLGEAGRARAAAHYDWSVVVRAYETLWSELADARRAAAAAPGTAGIANPLRQCPYRLFAEYPTYTIEDGTPIAATGDSSHDRLLFLRETPAAMVMHGTLASRHDTEVLLTRLRKEGETTVGALLADAPQDRRNAIRRAIGWLAKTGLARMRPRPPA
jgi:glycosyltransferase involved in cell wall biosynthesis